MSRSGRLIIGWIALTALTGGVVHTSAAADDPQPVRVSQFRQHRPIGLLGKTLGDRLIIEGMRAERVMEPNSLAVEKVDGQPLPEGVKIKLRDTDDLKPGVAYKLEGYESGAFTGYPGWLAPEAQQSFQYRSFFIVTRVIEPPAK